jgi:hypothetical protein
MVFVVVVVNTAIVGLAPVLAEALVAWWKEVFSQSFFPKKTLNPGGYLDLTTLLAEMIPLDRVTGAQFKHR